MFLIVFIILIITYFINKITGRKIPEIDGIYEIDEMYRDLNYYYTTHEKNDNLKVYHNKKLVYETNNVIINDVVNPGIWRYELDDKIIIISDEIREYPKIEEPYKVNNKKNKYNYYIYTISLDDGKILHSPKKLDYNKLIGLHSRESEDFAQAFAIVNDKTIDIYGFWDSNKVHKKIDYIDYYIVYPHTDSYKCFDGGLLIVHDNEGYWNVEYRTNRFKPIIDEKIIETEYIYSKNIDGCFIRTKSYIYCVTWEKILYKKNDSKKMIENFDVKDYSIMKNKTKIIEPKSVPS